MSALCRLCCKSLFALVIENSPGFRRDLRVRMWGPSSPTDKLTGDLGNVIEATQTGVRRSDRLPARKSSPGNFGLLQHNRHFASVRGTAPIRQQLEAKRTCRDRRRRIDLAQLTQSRLLADACPISSLTIGLLRMTATRPEHDCDPFRRAPCG